MQIVGYDSLDGALFVVDESTVERVPLSSGEELAYTLGARRCAGTIDGDRHLACDRAAAPYCELHTHRWVCARCTGTCLKDEMDCYDDHAIYLAAFAPDRFKVGVTKEWRLDDRLREQGADRAAHLRTVENGRIAREIEAELSKTVPVPDRVRASEKLEGLHRSVDEEEWRSLLSAFDPIETFAFDYGFDLDGRPVDETIASGTIRGTQGRLLVLDRGGSTYGVDMRSLVGYEIEAGRSDRRLQSSFAAFE